MSMRKILVAFLSLLVITLVIYLAFVQYKKNNANTLELTYKTNGGVPYKWEYKIEDESVVEFVGTKDITSEKDKQLDGGPISTNYIFKGKKAGKTTITFKYVSIVNGEVDKEEKVNVKVDKFNNISVLATTK